MYKSDAVYFGVILTSKFDTVNTYLSKSATVYNFSSKISPFHVLFDPQDQASETRDLSTPLSKSGGIEESDGHFRADVRYLATNGQHAHLRGPPRTTAADAQKDLDRAQASLDSSEKKLEGVEGEYDKSEKGKKLNQQHEN